MSLSKPRKTPMEEGPSSSRKSGETCTHQRQEDIINVAAVIRQEMMDDFDSINVAEKTARYLKLSVNTVRRYYNQRIGQVETLDDFTRDSVRHVIYRMYHEGKYLSMDTILLAIRAAEINFHGGKSALTKLLKIMGFKWQKDCGRKALMEETNICVKRICFLREYLQHMSDSIYVDFVYLDETWIFSRGTVSKIWQDDTKFTCKRQSTDDGKRFIVLHAGSRKGFVEGAELLFASKKTTGDYHGEMNGKNFETWMKNQLLISLEEPSIIVLDNAPYHSVQVEKLPTKSWKKEEYAAWLQKNGIAFPPFALKGELMALALANKPIKRYKVDEMIMEYGHHVLRLPPYHCQYNPIELVWAQCKSYYNKHTGRDRKYDDEAVRKIWEEALAQVTPESWSKNVDHCEKLIKEDWDQEMKMDARETNPPIIINLAEDTDEDDDEYDEEEVLATPL